MSAKDPRTPDDPKQEQQANPASSYGSLPGVEVKQEGAVHLGEFESQDSGSIFPAPKASEPGSPPGDAASPASSFGSLPGVDVGLEGIVDIGEFRSQDSGIFPPQPLPEPPSGQSLTSWTEVIRRQRAAQESAIEAEPVQVDAPSDKDILSAFTENKTGKKSGDTSEILSSEMPVFTAPGPRPSESDIDLGQAVPGLATGAGSEVGFDILFPPSDAGGAMPIPGEPPLSAVDFRPPLATAVDEESIPFATAAGSGISGVDLGAHSGVGGSSSSSSGIEPGRSSILDVLLRESGGGLPPAPEQGSNLYEFGDPLLPTPAPALPPAKTTMPNVSVPADRVTAIPTQPGIDLSGADRPPSEMGVDLSGPDSSFGSDEAVDLYAEASNPPSISDSGTLEISKEAYEESQRKSQLQESSSVDLNTPPSFPSHFDVDSGIPAPPAATAASESDIDLNLPPVKDQADSSQIHRGNLDSEQQELAARMEPRPRPREREKPPRAKATLREVIPASQYGDGIPRRRISPIVGAAIGLLVGVGAVLGAYFTGILPDRHSQPSSPVADNSAAVAQLRQESDAAKKEAADARAATESYRKAIAGAGIDPDRAADGIKALADARAAADGRVRQLRDEAEQSRTALAAAQKREQDARAAAETAKKAQSDAEKMLGDTRKQLIDANKTVDTARAEAATAAKAVETAKADIVAAMKLADAAKNDAAASRKALDEALASVGKALKAAGIEAAKPDEGIKKLADARSAAETKEKETATRLADSMKKEAELARAVDAAKKSADDAAKARDASEATLKSVGEKLVRAKFAAEKPDAAALIKGLDDALKAATTDATASLREELTKARAQETKLKTDLAAAREKEAEAAKAAAAAKVEAQRQMDAAKVAEQKAAAEATKLKSDVEKLRKDATDATAKANEAAGKAAAAEKIAIQEKANAERLASEVNRLKADNEQLARDIATVRELAELIKSQSIATGPSSKPDPAKLADRFFAEGVRSFHGGQYSNAEAAFRKAIQFRADDARYHYLLGLSLWMLDEKVAAEAAFEKGRDLELQARPPSRSISTVLERIQGPARQAMNAYRP
jgi:hypothetical protein